MLTQQNHAVRGRSVWAKQLANFSASVVLPSKYAARRSSTTAGKTGFISTPP
jgi:hypothetical protein